jgi:endonuclease IV
MVFLIGVNHIIQHPGFSFHQKEAAISKFSEHVEMKALELKVKTIAEEWSQEANKINKELYLKVVHGVS